MPWTDEVVEELKRLWLSGLTTSEIAKKLGVSKNSIVGKVHRLGLSGRPSPIKKKEEVAKKETKVATPVATKAPTKENEKTTETVVEKTAEKPIEKTTAKEKIKENKTTAIEVEKEEFIAPIESSTHPKSKDGLIRLVDLDSHTCRWPIGDPKDEKFHFCGKKVRIGQTYCEEHSETAYVHQTKK
ncbi:MAG: GcrA family cell cycle regulator [Alphaproteobacteria bacterium]